MNYSHEELICLLLAENGLAASKFYTLLDQYGTVVSIEQHFSDAFVEKTVGENYRQMRAALKKGAAALLETMEKQGIFAVTYLSEKFPESLTLIDDPPYVLFYMGDIDVLQQPCIAVIGTRKLSSYGRRLATDFTAVLSEHFAIVSGLAYGADSAAHESALKNGGKTVAVLGGGLVDIYPAANKGLAERIVESGGLVLTEYGTNALPLQFHFPHRNRLVAGLSQGLLVCQAPSKSGTLSTVDWALEQGKDVFVVPGEVYDAGFYGSNALIKSMQGVCVTTPRDILDYYHLDEQKSDKVAIQLDFEEQQVVEALSAGQMTFDQLVEKTKISPANLNFLLANLEIKSIIAKLPGNTYRLYGGLQ